MYFLKFFFWIVYIKEIYNYYFYGILVVNWKWKFIIIVVKNIIYKNRILFIWIGNVLISFFLVICLDWCDEGIYVEWSDICDLIFNELFVYEYVVYIFEMDGLIKYY